MDTIFASSNGLEMSSDLAKKLFDYGAILLVLNVPLGTEFGIDMKSWTSGHKFKGIKMIPPGYHFIYYNAVNKHGDVAPRLGFFHNFQSQEILVKIWNSEREELEDKNLTDEELENLKADLQNLDSYLGAYPYDVLNLWKSLTSHLNDDVLRKLSPDTGVIRSALELVAENSKPSEDETLAGKRKLRKKWGRALNEEEKHEALLPHLVPTSGTAIKYSHPEAIYPANSTPAQISFHFMDKTYALEQLICTHARPDDILGELQFSFVCFMFGLNYESFLHWKNLIELFCSCDDAIRKYTKMYEDFVSIVEVQLCDCVADEMEEEGGNFLLCANSVLCKHLTRLCNTILRGDEDDVLGHMCRTSLVNRINALKHRLSHVYGWEFLDREEEEEDGPVVVELGTSF